MMPSYLDAITTYEIKRKYEEVDWFNSAVKSRMFYIFYYYFCFYNLTDKNFLIVFPYLYRYIGWTKSL